MTKLPHKIEQFAQQYFAAQDRAESFGRTGKSFRSVDKKALARECKVLLESGECEHLWQLAQDLSEYQPGYQAITHVGRLNAFADHANVTYGRCKIPAEAPVKRDVVAIRVDYPEMTYSPRSDLALTFCKALENGMSVKELENHAQEVLVFANRQVQKGKIATSLDELIRSSGLTRREVADIVLEM